MYLWRPICSANIDSNKVQEFDWKLYSHKMKWLYMWKYTKSLLASNERKDTNSQLIRKKNEID